MSLFPQVLTNTSYHKPLDSGLMDYLDLAYMLTESETPTHLGKPLYRFELLEVYPHIA